MGGDLVSYCVVLSRVWLCDPMDCRLLCPQNFPLCPWILERVAIPTPGNSPDQATEPTSPPSPALAGGFLITVPPGKHSTGNLRELTLLQIKCVRIELNWPCQRIAGGVGAGGETPTHLVSETCKNKGGEGNGTPRQYSCLENPMDGGAW